jgi:hypothetical protein
MVSHGKILTTLLPSSVGVLIQRMAKNIGLSVTHMDQLGATTESSWSKEEPMTSESSLKLLLMTPSFAATPHADNDLF